MATRKGLHVFGNYAAPHILNALFIYVLCIKKMKMADKIVLHIIFKTQRPSSMVF